MPEQTYNFCASCNYFLPVAVDDFDRGDGDLENLCLECAEQVGAI